MAAEADSRPNILWITFEDICPDLGCYGVDYADTPYLDQLAAEGIRYTRAWSNAGMCAPARATLITGMYPPGTGAQNMRSEVRLPDFIRGFPEFLRRAGYYTSNHSKTDYNWTAPATTWTNNSRDWREDGWRRRAAGQPFFTVINITDTHSSQLYWRGAENYRRRAGELGEQRLHDPKQAPVPPYYPDLPEIRADLARYHDNITYADGIVGEILEQLRVDGLTDDTIVFFFSDHGRGMPRTKGWCFYSSLHVPLIIRFPEKFAHWAPGKAGDVEARIVSFVDFGPTVLSLADIHPPEPMQGIPFLGSHQGAPRELAFAYRDRMDERPDLIRSVWDGRFHYIRNYFPHLPWFHEQTRDYPHTQDSYVLWHRLEAQGKLAGDSAIYMAHQRPMEMLFDTREDPHELNNLAGDPRQAERLTAFRNHLHRWQDEIVDLGFMPESYWMEQFEARDDRTPRYTLARELPGLYPMANLRSLADQMLDPRQTPVMLDAWRSDNVPTRFWGGLSLLATSVDSPEIRKALQDRLDDASPTIRVLAAQCLAMLGDNPESLSVLLDSLTLEPPLLALRAANALDHLGEAARPALPLMKHYLKQRPSIEQANQAIGAGYPESIVRRVIEKWESVP